MGVDVLGLVFESSAGAGGWGGLLVAEVCVLIRRGRGRDGEAGVRFPEAAYFDPSSAVPVSFLNV